MGKKKRSRPSNQGVVISAPERSKENSEEERVLKCLTEAFASVSIQEAAAAYKEANGDANKAAELLEGMVTVAEYQSRNEPPSSGDDGSVVRQKAKGKGKKVVAAAGTVSVMLGKDYVRSVSKKSSMKSMDFNLESLRTKEDDEQFLYSMLGVDCDLSMAVVKDVLCQCKYDIEKAMNILLELSSSSSEQSKTGESSDSFTDSNSTWDSMWDSTSHSSESEISESIWFSGPSHRSYSKVVTGTEAHISTQTGISFQEIPQNILESLFNMPTPKNAEHEPNTMNWKKVVKKLASLGQNYDSSPLSNGMEQHHVYAKGEDYHVLRQDATQNWESMKSNYQKAAIAFSSGGREYAAHLAEQGRLNKKMAKEADEKASKDIFIARNKSIENNLTIDLHGQHVKQAMRLLKVHLVFGAYVHSVRLFRIITGCGGHGIGQSKLKSSVIDLLKREGIKWTEENRGTLLVKLDGRPTSFSFLDSESDDD